MKTLRCPALVLLALAAAGVVVACSRPRTGADATSEAGLAAATPAAGSSAISTAATGVSVTAADRQRLGIETAALLPAEAAARTEGFAIVLSAEPLAQLDTDFATARATATASRAALERALALYADQVSVSLAVVESARRQATADASQVRWLEQRVALEWGARGLGSPFASAASRRTWLDRLTGGRAALTRVHFPFGTALPAGTPSLHLERVAATAEGAGPGASLGIRAAWPAPEDPAVPGPAFFVLVEATQPPQVGERLRAFAAGGDRQPGVRIPGSAVVLSGGSAWCYVEGQASPLRSVFTRRALVLEPGPIPASDATGGYFVASGFAAGDQVVIRGAGLLLAQEVGAVPAAGVEGH